MKKKLKMLRTAAIAALIISIPFSVIFFAPSKTVYFRDNSRYSIKHMAGFEMLTYNSGKNDISGEIIKLNKDESINLSLLNYKSVQYVACIYRNHVDIYWEKTLAGSFEIEDGKEIESSFVSDFNMDGVDEIFLLLKYAKQEYGDELLILSFDGVFEKLFSQSYGKLNPWKVQVCDVDGDGEKEISLGVYTVAKYHPVYAKRPFIYYYHDNKLYPKWLGSRLSRPFEDYVFCDIDRDGMDELISIEITKEGKKELNSYKWKGFGFESIGCSKAYDNITDLGVSGSSVTALCSQNRTRFQKIFIYNINKLE